MARKSTIERMERISITLRPKTLAALQEERWRLRAPSLSSLIEEILRRHLSRRRPPAERPAKDC